MSSGSRKGAPWPPLAPGGDGLEYFLEQRPAILVERMAAIYGVPDGSILPVLGSDHGKHLVGRVFGTTFRVQDEARIEMTDAPSEAASAAAAPGLAVLRDLSVYGLIGAPCGAVIAHPTHIDELAGAMNDWECVPTTTVLVAEAVLSTSRIAAYAARFTMLKAQRQRIIDELQGVTCLVFDNPSLMLADPDWAAFRRWGVDAVELPEGRGAAITLESPEATDRLLAAMGVAVPPRPPARRAEVVRDTRETRIVCAVDLDRAEPVRIDTGVPFYDHMLDQVARHGSFSLILSCEGDLHIEAHHTIEDCALALGEALRQALGAREGLARFGFVAPLDEAEAAVTLDLSGRPLARFTGSFARPMIGAYPTEMTPHVFRSISDSLRATVHVKVEGEDDHHKTEACFKAFGRALRMAIRREGGGVPSTKGVLG